MSRRRCPGGSRLYACSMALADEKYMLFTTFRRDGEPVSTPVWVVNLGDGQVGFWTSSGSGKAKRLAHTSRVTVQPCNARGALKAGTDPVEATARLVTGGELDAIHQRVVPKYGFATKVTKLLDTLGGLLRGSGFPTAIAACPSRYRRAADRSLHPATRRVLRARRSAAWAPCGELTPRRV